jgi:hypothetical protein
VKEKYSFLAPTERRVSHYPLPLKFEILKIMDNVQSTMIGICYQDLEPG